MEKVEEKTVGIWEEVLGFIRSRVGDEVTETWLQSTKLGELNGTKATIVVPNKYFGQFLLNTYGEVINDALQAVRPAEEARDIEFIVGDLPSSPAGAQTPPTAPQPTRVHRQQMPNPRYTFENFVVGASNQFAHAASLAVADAPARYYNPLFIYGGVGLGKTHLLNSIGNFVMQKTDLRIAYMTGEQFTNEVIASIRHGTMNEFRRRYRNIDVLLIDDIQFLAGKERTQEEFFHTFNTLHEGGKQIVLSSDQIPKELPSIEERLRSRFEIGLIAYLEPPDFETRIAILKKKSEDAGIAIGDDAIHQLAEGLKNHIRELEGALTHLGAVRTFTGQAITTDTVKGVLRNLLGSQKKVIALEDVQTVVARRFQVKVSELKSKRRTKTVVHPRQIAMYLSRELTDASFPEIGREFGGKDHTTIIHACRQIEKAMDNDNKLRAVVESLKEEIRKA